jgi:hypothetical protein|uniref:ORF34 n=1 Tax=Nitrosopumilaceae spindle-shaped virus TaxID=3065433 RepID=A0AAT9JA36_9VIRU
MNDFIKKENSLQMFAKNYVCKVCNVLSFVYFENKKGEILCEECLKVEGLKQ